MSNEQETPVPVEVALAKDLADSELLDLLHDVRRGAVFGAWALRDGDGTDLAMVFLPIALGAQLPFNTGSIYEHLDKAGPRSVNGYPCFSSLRVLTIYDRIRLGLLFQAANENPTALHQAVVTRMEQMANEVAEIRGLADAVQQKRERDIASSIGADNPDQPANSDAGDSGGEHEQGANTEGTGQESAASVEG